MRQRPRSGYCEQCGCPKGALAPPRRLGLDHARAQAVAPWPLPGQREATFAALLGLLCAGLGWLPLLIGPIACAAGIALGSLARTWAGRSALAFWLGWAAVALCGAAAVPALSGL